MIRPLPSSRSLSSPRGRRCRVLKRDWPAVTRETRPWSRWWWQGSAVDRASRDLPLSAFIAYGASGAVTDLSARVGADRALD